MRGGENWLGRVVAALALATCCTTGTTSRAHEGPIEEHCSSGPAEKSIVVVKKKSGARGPKTPEQTAEELEPIAVSSGYTPELAETPQAAVPDLAEAETADPDAIEISDRSPEPEPQIVDAKPAETKVLSFHGITPGISTRINVLRTWGDPRSETTTAEELKYRFEQLRSVFVHFDRDVVDAIEVELPKPLDRTRLVSSLDLGKIRPTLITDSSGQPEAIAYPERGVVLRYDQEEVVGNALQENCPTAFDNRKIARVRIQPIKAGLFLQRAENELGSLPSQAIEDLQHVLKLDHDSADAKWLLSILMLETGRAVRAEHLAAEAVEAVPKNNAYRLQYARCLRKLARYDLAAKQAKQVFNDAEVEPLDKARALREMGLLASLGSAEVSERVVPLLTGAIDLADEIASSDDLNLGAAASKLLVEAHLDMALYISKGKFRKKEASVPEWIERASGISEQIIACDESQKLQRLHVAVTALAAGANLDPPVDPTLWIEEAELTAVKLKDATHDAQLKDLYDWNLGLAYFQAAQIEHLRDNSERSLKYCNLAEEMLGALSESRDELPDTAYLMGRLHFQTGVVYAIHRNDHEQACKWYDRAAKLLVDSFPVTTMSGPQQHGDALVSMGVSYWEEGRTKRAIKLTEQGSKLIEQAVEKGVLTDESLVVPYGNLAAMYEAEGQQRSAAKYLRLGKQLAERTTIEQRR